MAEEDNTETRETLAVMLEQIAKDLRSGDIETFKLDHSAQFNRVHSGEGRGFQCIPSGKFDIKLTYERKLKTNG